MPIIIPDMVEGSIDAVVDQVHKAFNDWLTLVAELWATRGSPLNLPHLPPSQVYISEGIHPLRLPAMFVVADRSPHDLAAQQWLRQRHQLLVGLVVESTLGAQKIQRIVWRYAQAAWLTLHDQNLGATRTQITEIAYGPTVWEQERRTGERTFRKDITLRVDATQREDFEH